MTDLERVRLMEDRQRAWFQYREDRDWAALQRRLAEFREREATDEERGV